MPKTSTNVSELTPVVKSYHPAIRNDKKYRHASTRYSVYYHLKLPLASVLI